MKKTVTRYLLLSVMAVFFSACGGAEEYLASTGYGAQESVSEAERGDEALEELPAEAICVVHISGAVRTPGVYRLPAGSRLIEAVEAAGGLREDAGADGCNLAQVIADGEQYRIPTVEEAAELPLNIESASAYASDGRLDINRATAEELKTLSGIGDTRARAIVAYREEHGAFTSTEELRNVSGIGEATYAAISGDIVAR